MSPPGPKRRYAAQSYTPGSGVEATSQGIVQLTQMTQTELLRLTSPMAADKFSTGILAAPR